MMLPLRSFGFRRWTRPALAAFALAMLASAPAMAQRRAVIVTGTVLDAQSGQGIAGAVVEVSTGERRVVTDAEGRFRLRLREGDHRLNASHLGYGDQQQAVAAQAG
ncbi:MAG TPA: carboxypeptidase regulatory-like domain-containing protein, partial [Longimicrobium sp.]|nr:carboxypeptidase regulatory-like domain-containing protein [Longimicrobium sp.]